MAGVSDAACQSLGAFFGEVDPVRRQKMRQRKEER
jgi:hypothetical protein